MQNTTNVTWVPNTICHMKNIVETLLYLSKHMISLYKHMLKGSDYPNAPDYVKTVKTH